MSDLETFWEERYGGDDPIWSGRPNRTLTEMVASLPPGRALDLGCGEGGDTIWLALRGWRVTGVDVSSTALARAAAAAARAGVDAEWIAHDLGTWQGHHGYDLVVACFLHSPVDIPRADILRRAAGLVTHGGHVLIISHAEPPPWASGHDRHHEDLLSPTQEVEALDLPPDEWEVLVTKLHERQATGPKGEPATLRDGVVLLRRLPD